MDNESLFKGVTEKKPNRRQRARIAMIAIREKKRTIRRKSPSDEMLKTYQLYAQRYQAGCDDSDFGRLIARLMPEDLTEARIMADFALCMTPPRDFAQTGVSLGISLPELRRERDRALERLEAAAHQLRSVALANQ
jgi:hypothetical protein